MMTRLWFGARRRRLIVVRLIAVCLAVAAMAGCGSGPSAENVLRQYVTATLTQQDDTAAARLTCAAPDLQQITEWQREIRAARQQHSLPELPAGLQGYTVTAQTERDVTATADVSVSLMNNGTVTEQLTRTFTFTVTREKGWKVCAAAHHD